MSHPCMDCGACCAYFRVAFYWAESDDETPGGVPLELTEPAPPLHRTMRGTSGKYGRHCHALEGRIGESVGCSIYASRPSVCREFSASYENGKKSKRCDEARMHHGLKPLRPEDWPGVTTLPSDEGSGRGTRPSRPPPDTP